MTLPRWLAPACTGLLAAWLVLALTPDGAGLSTDSVTYVGAASDLADGRALTTPFTSTLDPVTPIEAVRAGGHVPLVLWPPGYPVALAGLVAVGLDPAVGGSWLNALAIAVTAATLSVLARQLAGDREVAAWVAPPLALAAAQVLQLHQFLLTEPLALALNGLALALLVRTLDEPTGRRLAGLALTTALAPLVRIVGLVLPAVVAAALARWGGPTRRDRWRAAAVVVASALPALVWMAWSRTRTDAPARLLRFRPPPRVRYEEAVARGLEWLVPPPAPTALRAAIVALAVVAAVAGAALALRRRRAAAPLRPAGRLAVVLVGFVVVHVAAVVASATVVNDAVPIGGRLLVPIWPPVVALVVASAVRGTAALAGRHPALGAVAARVGVAATVVVVALLLLDARDELGHSRLAWELPPSSTDDGVVVVSNVPSRIWLETGRTSLVVPRRWSDVEGSPHPRLDQEVAELRAIAACRPTDVVLFAGAAFFTPYLLPDDEVVAALADLEPVVEQTPAATVLRLGRGPTSPCP